MSVLFNARMPQTGLTGAPPAPRTYTAAASASSNVTQGVTTFLIEHNQGSLGTKVMVLPNWETAIKVTLRTADRMLVEFSTPAPAAATLDWVAKSSAGTTWLIDWVPGGSVSAVVTHNLNDLAARVTALPSWLTYLWYTNAIANAMTVNFSVPPPSPLGGMLDYRAEQGDGNQLVTAAAVTATITHNLGSATAKACAMPSWNTSVFWTSKTANTIVLGFGTPAPTGASVNWRAVA